MVCHFLSEDKGQPLAQVVLAFMKVNPLQALVFKPPNVPIDTVLEAA